MTNERNVASPFRRIACRLSRVIGSYRLLSIAIEREDYAYRDRLALKGRQNNLPLLVMPCRLLSPFQG
ncbi:MAG: hypothetical protein IKR48_04055 [Kiritimatiellae bacterium]|nr:hypothetical protein [Kiritimatiellia bacterium]